MDLSVFGYAASLSGDSVPPPKKDDEAQPSGHYEAAKFEGDHGYIPLLSVARRVSARHR
jgi:hypothetical protein